MLNEILICTDLAINIHIMQVHAGFMHDIRKFQPLGVCKMRKHIGLLLAILLRIISIHCTVT